MWILFWNDGYQDGQTKNLQTISNTDYMYMVLSHNTKFTVCGYYLPTGHPGCNAPPMYSEYRNFEAYLL
jgi:hypothetical protein